MILSDLLSLPDEQPLSTYNLKEEGSVESFLRTLAPAITVETLTVKDLRDYLAAHPDNDHKSLWLEKEIVEVKEKTEDSSEPVNEAPKPPLSPEQLDSIAKPDRMEKITRQLVGGLYSLVLAYTILTFTTVIAMVAFDKKEFPSATLSAIIIVPTMMVAWYYMGIINRERRDILSALAGDKVNFSNLSSILEIFKKK